MFVIVKLSHNQPDSQQSGENRKSGCYDSHQEKETQFLGKTNVCLAMKYNIINNLPSNCFVNFTLETA